MKFPRLLVKIFVLLLVCKPCKASLFMEDDTWRVMHDARPYQGIFVADNPLNRWSQSQTPNSDGCSYDSDTLYELHRLFQIDPGERKPEDELLIRKALLALPLLGRNNSLQLFLRPEKDIYLTIFKKFTMRRFIKATHVTRPVGTVAIDTHVHTCYSHDSFADPAKVLLCAARRGLSGIAITDHDNITGARETQKIAARLIREHKLPESFFVIEGEEIASTKGHIIGLFLRKQVPSNMTPKATIQAIHEQGGLAIATHPLLPGDLGDLAKTLSFDAVESMDAAEELHFVLAQTSAQENRQIFYEGITKPKLGVSDAHDARFVGTCYTLLNCDATPEAVRSAIISGKVTPLSGMPLDDLRVLAKRRLPRIISAFKSINGPDRWLCKVMGANDGGFSLFPRPAVRLHWSKKF